MRPNPKQPRVPKFSSQIRGRRGIGNAPGEFGILEGAGPRGSAHLHVRMVVVSQTHRMSFRAAIFIALAAFLTGCGKSERAVVLYTSQDQIFAEPILADFTRKTGINVLPVFDSESVKTAGLL